MKFYPPPNLPSQSLEFFAPQVTHSVAFAVGSPSAAFDTSFTVPMTIADNFP